MIRLGWSSVGSRHSTEEMLRSTWSAGFKVARNKEVYKSGWQADEELSMQQVHVELRRT
jgi:hypothetical protein